MDNGSVEGGNLQLQKNQPTLITTTTQAIFAKEISSLSKVGGLFNFTSIEAQGAVKLTAEEKLLNITLKEKMSMDYAGATVKSIPNMDKSGIVEMTVSGQNLRQEWTEKLIFQEFH